MVCMGEALSSKIANMSFFCALLVVVLHCGGGCAVDSSLWWITYLTSDGFCAMAVPFFFVVSGYFLAGHFGDSYWWGHELGKRFRTLVVPYFVWCVLFLVFRILVGLMLDVAGHKELGTSYGFVRCGWAHVFGFEWTNYPLLGILWYVRCLMLFVLLSPVIECLIRRGCLLVLLVPCGVVYALVCAQYCHVDVACGFFKWFLSVEGVIYFSIGCFLRQKTIYRWQIKTITAAIMLLLGVTGVIAQPLLAREGVAWSGVLRVLFIPLILLPVWRMMPSGNFATRAPGLSFRIFLLHPFVLLVWAVIASRFRAGADCQGIVWLIKSIFVLVATIVSAFLIRKCFPGFSRLVFGGR